MIGDPYPNSYPYPNPNPNPNPAEIILHVLHDEDSLIKLHNLVLFKILAKMLYLYYFNK